MEYFLVGLFLLFMVIVSHEFGHFLAAKWCNVGVIDFGLGFGKRLLTKRIGDTDFHIHLFLPFGGYVRPLPSKDFSADVEVVETDEALKKYPGLKIWHWLLTPNLKHIEQRSKELRALGRISTDEAPYKHRQLILWGGVVGNMLFTIPVFFVGILLASLHVTSDQTARAARVSTMGAPNTIVALQGEPGKTLKAAGIRVGDTLVAVNGVNVGVISSEEFIYSFLATLPVNRKTAEVLVKKAAEGEAGLITVTVPVRDEDGYLYEFPKGMAGIGLRIVPRLRPVTSALERIVEFPGSLIIVNTAGIQRSPYKFNPEGRRTNPKYSDSFLSQSERENKKSSYWETTLQNFGFIRGITSLGYDLLAVKGAFFGVYFSMVFFFFSVVVSVFNLLPIPGADGYHLLINFIEKHRNTPILLEQKLCAMSGGGYVMACMAAIGFAGDIWAAGKYYLSLF